MFFPEKACRLVAPRIAFEFVFADCTGTARCPPQPHPAEASTAARLNQPFPIQFSKLCFIVLKLIASLWQGHLFLLQTCAKNSSIWQDARISRGDARWLLRGSSGAEQRLGRTHRSFIDFDTMAEVKARSTLVVLMLLLWTAAPALRCFSQSLTAAEQACCKAMAGACSNMSNHSCCEKIQSGTQPAVITASVSEQNFVATEALAFTAADLGRQLQFTNNTVIAASPPVPPSASTTVLRI